MAPVSGGRSARTHNMPSSPVNTDALRLRCHLTARREPSGSSPDSWACTQSVAVRANASTPWEAAAATRDASVPASQRNRRGILVANTSAWPRLIRPWAKASAAAGTAANASATSTRALASREPIPNPAVSTVAGSTRRPSASPNRRNRVNTLACNAANDDSPRRPNRNQRSSSSTPRSSTSRPPTEPNTDSTTATDTPDPTPPEPAPAPPASEPAPAPAAQVAASTSVIVEFMAPSWPGGVTPEPAARAVIVEVMAPSSSWGVTPEPAARAAVIEFMAPS